MRLIKGFFTVGCLVFFVVQAEDGIRDLTVTGVQTCALPISKGVIEFSAAPECKGNENSLAFSRGFKQESRPMSEIKWDLLVDRIKDGKCTPFLGAGACADVLPVGGAVAQRWAQKYGYPLDDSHDLIKVAQYIAVTEDPMWPKDAIIKEFEKRIKESGAPDFTDPLKPHALLADLPLPV